VYGKTRAAARLFSEDSEEAAGAFPEGSDGFALTAVGSVVAIIRAMTADAAFCLCFHNALGLYFGERALCQHSLIP
jgi:hypothetical protein